MDVKPASIVVLVVGLVLAAAIGWMLGPGASWWLGHVDGVTGLTGEKLASAVDAVRGRTLAFATGLAALGAVYYTARNADTARRTFQLGERGHDTDRFGKAAEQLGHDQAPVRLAGLYALEQLAQNNPAMRQTIVDVICAYLRMPYTPPRDGNHEDLGPAVPRAAIGGITKLDSTKGRDPHEERQVRLTAQRILAAHLRDPAPAARRWWRPATSPSDAFWPGIRLDLTGATLVDLDLSSCRIGPALFNGAVFTDFTTFEGATFTDAAQFPGAVFGFTTFQGATFTNAWFGGATFKGSAWFKGVTFTSDIQFVQTTFMNGARFDGATFTAPAAIVAVTFRGSAQFEGATFMNDAWFEGATFASTAAFNGAAFKGAASFNGATFTGDAGFNGASFAEEVRFLGATFTGETTFDKATFGGIAEFPRDGWEQAVNLDGALVTSSAMGARHVWPPGWQVEPEGRSGGVLRRDPSCNS
ncbi:pentapeptide repeat-containing protein [Nonomuraea sp. NPDC049129]|uniref:pentapeptide repeat-containing protein n=1 Tax=Nonomuraea sp. NPDC049129 TaxID=3155272 RepID=UPI0033C51A19